MNVNVKFAMVAAFFFSFFYFGNKYPDIPIAGLIFVSLIIGAAQILIFGNRGDAKESADTSLENPAEKKEAD